MKKKLLSEAQVRRFMGLAGINKLNEMAAYKKEDSYNETMYSEDLMEEEDEDLGVEMTDDMPDDTPDDMPEDSAADIDISDEKVEEFLDAAATIKDMADMLSGAVDGMEADLPQDDEEDEEDVGLDDADVEVPPTPEEEKEEEDAIVNEVARRVAKRIVEAKRAHKRMNEALGRKK